MKTVLIATWEGPHENICYRYQEDPYGTPITGSYASNGTISNNELDKLLEDNKISLLSEDSPNGIGGAYKCYKVLKNIDKR